MRVGKRVVAEPRDIAELPPVLKISDIARYLRVCPKQVRRMPLKRVPGLGSNTIRVLREDFLELIGLRREPVRDGR